MPFTFDLDKHLAAASLAIERARSLIAERPHDRIASWKGTRDYSTDVDIAIEDELKELLLRACPGTRLLAEENNARTTTDGLVWVLDPIDGTVNFSRGHPNFGVSLALLADGKPMLSIVDFPALGRTYRAIQGQGAWRGRERIAVSKTDSLIQSIVAVGDFAVDGDVKGKNSERLGVLQQLSGLSLRVRMQGTAALDLCMVADGTIDAAILLSNSPWDVQGGALIVLEAGGAMYDAVGESHTLTSAQTICSNLDLKPHLIAAVF